MPLLEIVIGDDTDPDTVTAAVNFAQAIKKQPITCYEVPGFVVNRILNSASAEVWRAQEEGGLSIQKVDQAIQGAQVAPMGPFFLIDLLGLDTVLHVAEHLEASYEGDRFYVHQGMQRLVARSSWAPRPAAPASTRTASRRSRATPSRPRTSPTGWPTRRSSRPASCSRRASPHAARSTSA
jgi:hypothetical protein